MSRAVYKTSAIPKSVSAERIDRLSQVIASSGLGRREFAAQINTTESNLSEMLHGRSGIAVPLAERIARAFGVSPGWLLFGETTAGQSVAEPSSRYGRRVRLPVVGAGEAVELPEGTLVYEVEDDGLEPVWHRGQRLLVVRAEKGEAGPGIVRRGRTAWRVVGVLF